MIFSVFIILQICKLFSVKNESNYNWILLNFYKNNPCYGDILSIVSALFDFV